MLPAPDEGLTLLGGLTPREFLAEHWQRRPLLVRGALPGWRSPVDPDTLADLACEDDVESRLVLEREPRPWSVRYGPFEPDDLTSLPSDGWTLLVHGLERLVQGAAALQDRFRFVPDWRFDDVMASVAPPGGSVGPHVDAYDVFLVQAEGRRRWLRSARSIPEGDELLVEDADARVLRSFTGDEDDVLEPGDLLYLPPGVPHHGIALDPCVTLSVGFRAPDVRELGARLLGQLLEEDRLGPRYADPGVAPADRPGHIRRDELERLVGLVRDALADGAAARRRIGAALTEPRGGLPDTDEPITRDEVHALLRDGATLGRPSPAAIAWTTAADGALVVFAAGEAHDLPATARPVVEALCGAEVPEADIVREWLDDPTLAAFVLRLLQTGALIRCGPQSP